MKKAHLKLILAMSVILLSIASSVVVIQGASDEPYMVFRRSHALVQIGVAMVLMLLWIQLAGGIIYGVVRGRISLWWLPLLLWVLICEFYLYQSPRGYIHDITNYVSKSH